MNPLLLPYVFNIAVLIPVGLLTLFGGSSGCRWAFQNKFPESEGIRTILGSIWTAILGMSVLGLFMPFAMTPLLVMQVIYKSLWLVVFVLPRVIGARGHEVPWGMAITFLVIVVSYPLVIPWEFLISPRGLGNGQ